MGPQFFVDGGFVCTYKGITRLLGRGSVRITPAHAGKRGTSSSRTSTPGDHPRTRGEKSPKNWQHTTRKGSPPHTRGKVHLIDIGVGEHRITPAHAGKRITSIFPAAMFQDHPRTRGEKLAYSGELPGYQGSPPHTRGKEKLLGDACPRPGITPAHAGKSLFCISSAKSCGGSPPHTRGKAPEIPGAAPAARITPAHAGKS